MTLEEQFKIIATLYITKLHQYANTLQYLWITTSHIPQPKYFRQIYQNQISKKNEGIITV